MVLSPSLSTLAEPNQNLKGQGPECLCDAVHNSKPPRKQNGCGEKTVGSGRTKRKIQDSKLICDVSGGEKHHGKIKPGKRDGDREPTGHSRAPLFRTVRQDLPMSE